MKNINLHYLNRSFLLFFFTINWLWSFGQSFNTNGNASYLGGLCYELTPSAIGQVGTIFSNDPIDLNQNLIFEATVNFGTNDGSGADGIVFILSTDPDAIGGGGGGIGYWGITPSIAVEFDTYQNTNVFDPVDDHMAIISNGDVTHAPPSNLSGPISLGNIETGQDYCFSATWNPNTQTLTAGLNGNYLSYTGDIVNSIFGGNPIVHYGFSSATGLSFNRHVICVVPIAPEPMPDAIICQDETIQLQADLNGTQWSWEPDPTLSNLNISNPVASPDVTTTYIVGVSYLCSAVRYDTVVVTVNPDLSANASNTGPQCEGENITLNAWGGDWYNWTGPLGFSSDLPNPVLFGVTSAHAGTYVVTITDDNGCTSVASTILEVYPIPVVSITEPAQPFCETGDPVQLTANPPGGDWDGNISMDGIFNPASAGVGDHVIGYYYTDGNNCSASTEIVVSVVANIPATITPPGPFCEEETMVALSADPPGGMWGGVANAAGQIFPNTLSPGLHPVNYSLTTATACHDTEIQIEIVAPTTLVIPDLPDFCEDDPDYQLTGFEPVGGVWSGAASPTGVVEPQELGPGDYQVTYTYTPSVCPAVSGSASFSVFGSPGVQNIERICDATATTYIVQFEITGGDPSGYMVVGSVTGTIGPGNPAVFISDAIPTGASYSFSIFDANHCDTVFVTGTYSCDCITSMGNMDQTPLTVCEGESIIVPAASGYVLDPNDTLIYVLHTGNPMEYIVIGEGTTFFFEPPLEAGVTYFVDALIGNAIPGQGVDLTDPCLAITPGPTVMWQANPTGSFSAPTDICDGDAAILTFTMTGGGPFDIHYLENNTPFTISSVGSPYSIEVYPVVNTSYTFLSVTDLAGNQCTAQIDITVDIAVNEATEIEIAYTICQGDSIFLAGAYQDSPGIYYDTITGDIYCDTLVTSTLSVISDDITYMSGTTCHIEDAGVFENVYINMNGCDSLVISTIMVVESDTSYQYETTCDPDEEGVYEIEYVGEDGCDSLHIVTVTLIESDTTFSTAVTCDPQETGTYTDSYIGENGCDSIVITTVTLTTPDTSYMAGTSCNAQDVGVFTDTYPGQNGCDSTVITTITYSESDTTYFNSTTCDEQQAGNFTNTYIDQNGCDSVVILTVTLALADTVLITGTTCDAQQAGVFTNTYSDQNGCDSIVISTISLTTGDTTHIPSSTCDAQQAGVFTNTYTGQNGCDSTVVLTITLTTADTMHIAGTTCDEQQVGVFINTYASQNGCDSIVVSTIALTTADTMHLTGTTCDGQQVGVFTNTYTGQNGCDSIVVSTITLTTADTMHIAGTTCDEQQAGVFTNTYTGQNGCDSIVVSTITLTTADTMHISGTTCDEQQVGVFTNTYTGQNGCDSVVISAISLTTSDTFHIAGTTCDEQQVGVFTNTYTALNGCDSTVISTITLASADTMHIGGTTCDEQQAGVFTNTYIAHDGCDSTVIETVIFMAMDTTYLASVTCASEDTGTVINIYAASNGCDSVVIAQTLWSGQDVVMLLEESCQVSDTGTVTLQFENIHGCDSTVVIVTSLLPTEDCGGNNSEQGFYAPNAFSPNHDGINDYFYISTDEDVFSGIEWFRIYDRWGGMVMEIENGHPNDPAFGWDGTQEGQPLNPGVFIWQIHLTYADGSGKMLWGDVTLLR